jgi:hypothetical protein
MRQEYDAIIGAKTASKRANSAVVVRMKFVWIRKRKMCQGSAFFGLGFLELVHAPRRPRQRVSCTFHCIGVHQLKKGYPAEKRTSIME